MISFYRPDFGWPEFLAALSLRGPTRNDFEAAVAARAGARYGLAFAYGRSGIIALLKALNIADMEVILPAYTCTVVVQAVVVSGNRPVFVDIDLADYNMNLHALKDRLSSRTGAVIGIHNFGYPINIDTIREIVDDPRVLIIEDSAAGLSTFSPGATTIRGDAGLFSFGHGKHLSTVGGGVLVTDSADIYERLKAYRDEKMNRLPAQALARRWARLMIASGLMLSGPMYELLLRVKNRLIEEYPDPNLLTVKMAGDYATAYADFQARMGMLQLRKLEAVIAKRRALAELYDSRLQNIPHLVPAPLVAGATYLLYNIRVERRDEIDFRQRMFDLGVGVERSFSFALPSLNAYQAYARGTYPCAEQAAREVVNLPIYPRLRLQKAEYVAECARRCMKMPASVKVFSVPQSV